MPRPPSARTPSTCGPTSARWPPSAAGSGSSSAGPLADDSRETGTQVRGPGEDDPGLVASQGIGSSAPRLAKQPSFGAVLITIVLSVLLMLLEGVGDLTTEANTVPREVFDLIGAPTIALLLAVLLAYFTLGRGAGMRREQVNESLGSGLPGIAAILLIVAAGGGFKQVLVDAGIANVIADWATGKNISVLLLGWLVAVGIRLATGSATVATTTAAGIVGGLAATLST